MAPYGYHHLFLSLPFEKVSYLQFFFLTWHLLLNSLHLGMYLARFYGMQLLILCVKLPRSWGVQIFGYTLFLGVSGKVFLDEINICFGELSEAVHPPQGGRASWNLSRARMEQKDREEKNSAFLSWLLELGHFLPLSLEFLLLDWNSHHRVPWFLGLWTQTSLHHELSCILRLQQTVIPLNLHNHVSQFLIISIYMYVMCICNITYVYISIYI